MKDKRISDHSTQDEQLDPRIAELIASRSQQQPKQRAPRWLPAALKVLPFVLITVTLVNLLIGVIAAVTPYLGALFGSAVTDPIYSAYSLICPQRQSHTFFLEGRPMAFEQRDLSMHIGFGIGGLLYLWVSWLRKPLPHWALIAGVAPLLIDVLISTVEIRPSTAISRLWTGALASAVIVWWSYPRFEAELGRVQGHARRMLARQKAADQIEVSGRTKSQIE